MGLLDIGGVELRLAAAAGQPWNGTLFMPNHWLEQLLHDKISSQFQATRMSLQQRSIPTRHHSLDVNQLHIRRQGFDERPVF